MSIASSTKKSLDSYLNLMGFHTAIPNRLDLFSKRKVLMFFGPNQEGLNCVRYLIKLANAQKKAIARLKIIICLHHIIMTNNEANQCVLDEAIEDLLEHSSIQNGDAGKWIRGLSQVYYSYLRKVCINNNVYWQIKNGDPYLKSEPFSILITRAYMIINIIRSIFPTKEFILNFGRYFKSDYPIVIDVNICIVEDMAILYTGLAEIISHLFKSYKTKLNLQQTKQLLTIIDELFILHQNLYILFYNRYYATEVDSPTIRWFKIQPQQYKQLKNSASNKKKKNNSIVFIDSFDLSKFQKTYFSYHQTRKYESFEAIEI